jgi:hypothetical protein
VAAPDGELLWVSGVLPGKTVDITAARRFGIAEKVLEFLGLLADLGYIGLHPQAITGYKRKRGEKALSAGKKAANVALAGLRRSGNAPTPSSSAGGFWRVTSGAALAGSPRSSRPVQTLQYLIRDPFGSTRTVTTSSPSRPMKIVPRATQMITLCRNGSAVTTTLSRPSTCEDEVRTSSFPTVSEVWPGLLEEYGL